jgi:outer membrane protein
MFARNSHRSSRAIVAAAAVTFVLGTVVVVGAGAQTAAPDTGAAQPVLPLLTLRQCADIALESSLQLLIAGEQVQISDEDVKSAKGAFLPDFSVSASYGKDNRTDYDKIGTIDGDSIFTVVDSGGDLVPFTMQVPVGSFTEDVSVRSTSKSLSASANLTLFDGLANLNSLSAAKASREAAVSGEAYSRALILQNVGIAYYTLLRSLALRDVKVEDRDRAALELERTETYFRLGSAARADVLQQKVRLENTHLALVTAENAVDQAFADLAHAMNRPLATHFDIDRSSLDTDMTIDNIDALYAEAIANRSDLKASEFTVTARRREAAAATGPLLPQVNISADYRRANDESPYKFGSQTSQSFSWGGQVSLAVFDRYQSWTRRAQAKAQARIADYNLQQAQLDAQLEVRRFHISMTEAKERLAVSRETITAAEEDLRLARERFRVGAGTQLDRIAAEVALAQAKADEIQAICDFLTARLQLYRAVGRLDGERMIQS